MLADCYLANEDTVGLERFCVPPSFYHDPKTGSGYVPDSEGHFLKARVIAQALELAIQLEEERTRFASLIGRCAPLRRFFLVHVASRRANRAPGVPPRFTRGVSQGIH